MAKSNIHIEAGRIGYFAHNDRSRATKNSIFHDEDNYTSCTAREAIGKWKKEVEIRTQAYLKNHPTRKNLHSKTLTHLSAIVNLNENHGENDVKKVCELLEQKFGAKVVQYSIHRDEGHLKNEADEIRNLHENSNLGDEIKNYHAHIEFVGIDSEGSSIRKKLGRKELSELQTENAKILNMERSENRNYLTYIEIDKITEPLHEKKFDNLEQQKKEYQQLIKNAKGKNNKRLDTYDYKEAKEKEQKIAKKSDLTKSKKDVKKEFQEAGAKREDYAKLEQLNKELLEKLEAKELTLEEIKEVHERAREDLQETLEARDEQLLQEQDVQEKFIGDMADIVNTDANEEEIIFVTKNIVRENEELEKRENENSITNDETYQQKIFYQQYENQVKDKLKGYYVDQKNQNGVKFTNRAKNINIIDQGNTISSESSDEKNMSERVKLMIDIAKAKKWDLNSLYIKGGKEFRAEMKKQIDLETQKKKKKIEEKEKKEDLSMEKLRSENEKLKNQNTYMKEKIEEIRKILKFPESSISAIVEKIKSTFEKFRNISADSGLKTILNEVESQKEDTDEELTEEVKKTSSEKDSPFISVEEFQSTKKEREEKLEKFFSRDRESSSDEIKEKSQKVRRQR